MSRCFAWVFRGRPDSRARDGGPVLATTPGHSRPHEQGATHGHLLSEISKPFYGDAKNYMKIFNANKDSLSDPDKIRVGQVLKIPAA
jgi:hypothetical protein